MPQLDFSLYPNLIFWLVVALLALYFILSRVALPRIGNVLAERNDAIANDIEMAALLKRRAEEAEAAYNAALARARDEAHKIAAETRAGIDKELASLLAKADAEIAVKAGESEKRIAEIRDNAARSVEEVARDDRGGDRRGAAARRRRPGGDRRGARQPAEGLTPWSSSTTPTSSSAIGFVIFVGILIYVGVPGMITRKLDERAVRIRAELDEARALRDEAQTLLAGYERRQKEVKAQAEDIVVAARSEAENAAEAAKEEIRRSVARRMQTAGEQIAAAEQAAVRQIKDQAVTVAIAAAADVLRGQIKAEDANRLIDSRDHRGRGEAALIEAALDCASDRTPQRPDASAPAGRAAGGRAWYAVETRKAQLRGPARRAVGAAASHRRRARPAGQRELLRAGGRARGGGGARGSRRRRPARGADDRGGARPDRERQLRRLRPLRRADRRRAPRRGAAHPVLPGLRRRPLSYPSDGLATISQTIARTAAKAGRPQANQMR